jgi:O-6-methylguanine DNA methyltransferase
MSSKLTPEQVYQLLLRIPAGRVTTYGEIARVLGTKGYRAVGRILNQNPNAPEVPCHRVVMSDGSLGGYAHGVARKIELLTREGVRIEDGRVCDFWGRFVGLHGLP